VAQLANVGLTWYTWLEQGRDVQPSDGVLRAIADALRLDTHEREHLYALVRPHSQPRRGGPTPAGQTPAGQTPAGQTSAGQTPAGTPPLEELVEGFEPDPAYVISARFDVLAHNRAARLLFGDLGPGPPRPTNLMRLAFTDPAWRELIVDWDDEAARHVAMYRAAMALHRDDSVWTELPDELTRLSPEFAHYWSRGDVAGPEQRLKRFRHPRAGTMTFHSMSLLVADDPTTRIVILHPSRPVDAERLEVLLR
jgi:transcriptional regulator with XRE-family HTH domain